MFRFYGISEGVVGVDFPEEMLLDEALKPQTYLIRPDEVGAVPTLVLSVSVEQDTVQDGETGQVLYSDNPACTSFEVDTVDGSFLPSHIGDYFFISGETFGQTSWYRIRSYLGSVVTLDKAIPYTDPANGTFESGSFVPGTGSLHWAHKKGAKGAVLGVSPMTLGREYLGYVTQLICKATLEEYTNSFAFLGVGVKPRLTSVQFLSEEGSVSVTFDQRMRLGPELLSTGKYQITGPTSVEVRGVTSVDPNIVALRTLGMGEGEYTLSVSSDLVSEAGNQVDPLYNSIVFTGSIPLVTRSIFTDKGPIAKAPLVLQSGTGGEIQVKASTFFGNMTLNEVVLSGGNFNSSHVGKSISLGGTTLNEGAYLITGIVNGSRLKVQADFRLPDPDNGALTWSLFDPKTGEIADDPSDVTVRINGIETTPISVNGLLGQVLLETPPGPTDDVKIDYSWVQNPTLEVKGLNSKEFRWNNWDNTYGNRLPSSHSYKYRNVLATPVGYATSTLLASLTPPLERALHYRAFERSYSVAFNDPNLLVLNTPHHRIAYPPLSREVSEASVSYMADTLPEGDTTHPWARKGFGVASIVSGALVVRDNTSGPFPTGNPIFWTTDVDLTFPNVYASTWRMKIDSTTPNGVYTGVSVGWSDSNKVLLVGFLLDGTTRKIGILKKGCGNKEAFLTSWGGGVVSNVSTGDPFEFDWSIYHSYRLLKDQDGVIRFFVDGEVVEDLRVTEEELPFLEELDDPFDQVQNVFFGSLSRQAQSVSTWDFFKYILNPLNPGQSTTSIFVSFEGDNYPEEVTPNPWTPIGYHGNESLYSNTLLLDSTSATTQATEEEVGLMGGDFKGFIRLEPLLGVSSDVALDFSAILRTYTHGISPNSVMVVVDDGSRLVQVSLFPTQSQPKLSYGGRSMPQESTPNPWTSLGDATAEMVGRTLRITDDTTTSGRVFAINDLAPIGSDTRVIEDTLDWYAEAKLEVLSFTADETGFCGATLDVFDGTRTIGILLQQDPVDSTLQVFFHSDGTLRTGPLASYNFNWNDGTSHVYRLVKSTSGDLVSLFIDNNYLGYYPYSSFDLAYGDPTYSFGSSTPSSVSSMSTVEWHYANVWRAQPETGVRKYLGIWKGSNSDSLLGYYLPTKVSGTATLAGNVLTDPTADFSSVQSGDDLVIDSGPNTGVYSIESAGSGFVTISTTFQLGTTSGVYRIPRQIDWATPHKYRLVRDPGGFVALFLDSESTPMIQVDYNETTLPASSLGIPYQVSRGLPSISWGSFDPTNLTQTAWDYLRYGIVRVSEEGRIVPHHQILNQRNIMSSPEHLFGSVLHDHTQYSSSSTGVPNPWEDYVENPSVPAFTNLNEGTPLVPQTQTYEVRRPTPEVVFLSSMNSPSDVLNGNGFSFNDGNTEVRIVVPDDVLYNSLQVIEKTTGAEDLIAPFSDSEGPIVLAQVSWQKTVCGVYDGSVLPEVDSNFGTPWELISEDPSQVTATVYGGILTYSVGASGARTVYKNPTPLPDPIGLSTRVEFSLKLLNDSSFGSGDTGVRFGFSALGLTVALAFVSTPLGDREVRVIDLNTDRVLGATSFDYLDGNFHTYRLVKNVADGTLDFLIDP